MVTKLLAFKILRSTERGHGTRAILKTETWLLYCLRLRSRSPHNAKHSTSIYTCTICTHTHTHSPCSETGPRCPVDNTKVYVHQLFKDNFAKREVLSLNVHCSADQCGCSWQGELRDLQVHNYTCAHTCIHVHCNCSLLLQFFIGCMYMYMYNCRAH